MYFDVFTTKIEKIVAKWLDGKLERHGQLSKTSFPETRFMADSGFSSKYTWK